MNMEMALPPVYTIEAKTLIPAWRYNVNIYIFSKLHRCYSAACAVVCPMVTEGMVMNE